MVQRDIAKLPAKHVSGKTLAAAGFEGLIDGANEKSVRSSAFTLWCRRDLSSNIIFPVVFAMNERPQAKEWARNPLRSAAGSGVGACLASLLTTPQRDPNRANG